MNLRLKRRLVVVTGVIIIAILSILAVVASTTASKTVTVAQAASGEFNGSRVQVTGKVVDNSYTLEGNVLSFSIYEDADRPDGADDFAYASDNASGSDVGASGAGTTGTTGATGATGASDTGRPQLKVTYDRGVAATFGNQVTAICTGTINASGVLVCTELVTKCPSKYESSTDSLSVSQLLAYGEQIIGKPVRVTGAIQEGTLTSAVERKERFVLVDGGSGTAQSSREPLPVLYSGALSDELQDGSELVLTGSLNSSGQFEATVVALRG